MSSEFTLLSYNAHLFEGSNPAFFSPSLVYEDESRSAAILQRANGRYDVLGFTEVWADKMRERFAKSLAEYDSYVPQPNVSWIKRELAGSPGMVLSVTGDWIFGPSFDYYRGMVRADTLAYKGVAYGVARIDGKPVGLVQTHAQASYTGSEAEDRIARDQQLQETLFPALAMVRSWFESQSLKGPIVLLGDLNIVGESDEYSWLSDQLGSRGFQDCWTKTHPGSSGYSYVPADNPLVARWDDTQTQPQRLDFIFLDPGGTETRCKEIKVMTDWKTPIGGNNVDLSDHYPVQATFDLGGKS